MATRNLRLLFMQMTYAAYVFANLTCPLSAESAGLTDSSTALCFPVRRGALITTPFDSDGTCPTLRFSDLQGTLDATATPVVEQLVCWQQGSSPDRKLHKQLPRHATLGSGADMATRNLRLLFMQGIQNRAWTTRKHRTFQAPAARKKRQIVAEANDISNKLNVLGSLRQTGKTGMQKTSRHGKGMVLLVVQSLRYRVFLETPHHPR
nr:uncharacterized protein LOC129382716 [Dermacentor andersoni]